MKKDEFYIGWMPEAPAGYAKHVYKYVAIIFVAIAIIGSLLALQQKKFSTASFEFGQLTELTGTYSSQPVPSLRIRSHSDPGGRSSFLTIPLVGYGKSGASGVMQKLEQEQNRSLNNMQLTLKGTLLYSDGKTLLQVDYNDHPLVRVGDASTESKSPAPSLGRVELTGEILDPKCYFGVMKPGSGKPHRDCAIRCIEGGINPVFWVRDEKGNSNYYLLLRRDGQSIAPIIKNHIAEPARIKAEAKSFGDWIVLYIDDAADIHPTGQWSWFKTRDNNTECAPAH